MYEISDEMKDNMKNFFGGYADDVTTIDAIRELYQTFNYTVDTHTAVAYQVYSDYVKKTGDNTQTLIASTASPFKFPRSVLEGLGEDVSSFNDFELVELLSKKAELVIPNPIKNIDKRPILHSGICDKSELHQVVLDVLK